MDRQIEVVTELSRKAIYENARTAQSQSDFNERNSAYIGRHRKAMEQIEALETVKRERLAKSKTLDIFIRDIERKRLPLPSGKKPYGSRLLTV